MIGWMINNWYIVAVLFAAVCVGTIAVYEFVKLPAAKQIEAMKEWLKYAVTMAEKELGSGTGQLKLRMVYDLFVSKFTWLAQIISFNTFSGYVDEALGWLNEQLTSNKAVSALVDATKEQETEKTEA